jgi:predicted enzyme related to lactoylglutathione lyase
LRGLPAEFQPVNALGYLRVMFTVEDIDDTLARLRKRGAELVGEWSSTKTRTCSATSGGPKDCSSGWPKNSAER